MADARELKDPAVEPHPAKNHYTLINTYFFQNSTYPHKHNFEDHRTGVHLGLYPPCRGSRESILQHLDGHPVRLRE